MKTLLKGAKVIWKLNWKQKFYIKKIKKLDLLILLLLILLINQSVFSLSLSNDSLDSM